MVYLQKLGVWGTFSLQNRAPAAFCIGLKASMFVVEIGTGIYKCGIFNSYVKLPEGTKNMCGFSQGDAFSRRRAASNPPLRSPRQDAQPLMPWSPSDYISIQKFW